MNRRDRSRYIHGPDTRPEDHLPGKDGGLHEGRWAYWRRAVTSIATQRGGTDMIAIVRGMRVTEVAVPVLRDQVPRPKQRQHLPELPRARR